MLCTRSVVVEAGRGHTACMALNFKPDLNSILVSDSLQALFSATLTKVDLDRRSTFVQHSMVALERSLVVCPTQKDINCSP